MQNQPNFPGFKRPSIDFEEVRDDRRAHMLYVDIDLSTARTIAASTALVLNISGNTFYVDQDTSKVGNATIHIQDATLGAASSPVFVLPGFIAKVPFTQILIENTAQSGKILRIHYGVDLDFVPGVNATISLGGAVRSSFTNTQKTVTNVTGQLIAGNTARNYLLVQNKDATANLYLNFGAGAATVANGVKIPPGGNFELNSNLSTDAIQAIGDTASNANIVVVEG